MLEGIVRATVVPGKETGKTKYEMYYKFEETVPKIPSHRILAIRRGTRENVLSYTIDTDSEKFITTLLHHRHSRQCFAVCAVSRARGPGWLRTPDASFHSK